MKYLPRAAAVLSIGALALAACGTPPEKSDSGSGEKKAGSDFKACMVSDSGGFDDKSFNETSKDGLDKAEKDLGIKTASAQSQNPSQFTPNIDNLVSQDCNLIFTVGFMLAKDTATQADKNPDVNFAIVDSTAQDKDGNPIEVKNVKPLSFDTVQAAYLAGYLSAGMSKTGKVATYGGMKIPTVTIFMDGFADGVKKYNEVHKKNIQLLGWDKDKQSGSFVGNFEDQGKGAAITDNLFDQGADIVMPVAGPVGAGTLASAKKHDGAMVVWVDTDGYESNSDAAAKKLILTSVVKGLDHSVEDVTKSAKDGKFDNQPYVGTLENGGVDIAPYHDFDSKVPAALKDEVKQLKQDIIDGKIKVESPASPK